ncbi:hypothetical protein NTGBS_500009 [Candidatus Nitrotoga sp. BS]|nr:hypothetical protein NTGBS_500009 [Candidatus Nitrotoga sp. BS]
MRAGGSQGQQIWAFLLAYTNIRSQTSNDAKHSHKRFLERRDIDSHWILYQGEVWHFTLFI